MVKLLHSKKIIEKRNELFEAETDLMITSVKTINTAMQQLHDHMKRADVPQEIMEKEITGFGNSAHIIMPKEYEGKKALIIVKK